MSNFHTFFFSEPITAKLRAMTFKKIIRHQDQMGRKANSDEDVVPSGYMSSWFMSGHGAEAGGAPKRQPTGQKLKTRGAKPT